MAAAYLAQNIILPMHVDPAGGSPQTAVFVFDAGLFPGGEIPTTWAATFDIAVQGNDGTSVKSTFAYGTLKRASDGSITVEHDEAQSDAANFGITTVTGGTDQLSVAFGATPSFAAPDVVASMRLRFLYAAET